ncbi:hypothetical protein B0H19DRAFT_1068528 [Mycena capillaripes]|nr:hypothetical protein B0H19DRAFT_1068528 [Mycena capillaripes]
MSFGTGLSDGSCKHNNPWPFRKAYPDWLTVPFSEVEEARAFLRARRFTTTVDIPLDVVSVLPAASSASVTTGFAVSENGGLARSGDAEKSDAEEEAVPSSAPLGSGQRKKIGTSLWEEIFFGRLQKIEYPFTHERPKCSA